MKLSEFVSQLMQGEGVLYTFTKTLDRQFYLHGLGTASQHRAKAAVMESLRLTMLQAQLQEERRDYLKKTAGI